MKMIQEGERRWQIDPILFDAQLIDWCEESIQETCGKCLRLPSGPLHDAAEVSLAGIPTSMMFVQSLRGLSHTRLMRNLEALKNMEALKNLESLKALDARRLVLPKQITRCNRIALAERSACERLLGDFICGLLNLIKRKTWNAFKITPRSEKSTRIWDFLVMAFEYLPRVLLSSSNLRSRSSIVC